VHYIGYATVYDEWKDISELEDITTASDEGVNRSDRSEEENGSENRSEIYNPYSVFSNLRFQIKKSMICSSTRSPKVHITTEIDILWWFKDGWLSYQESCRSAVL